MSTYINRAFIVSVLLLFVGFGSPTSLFAGACPEIPCEGVAEAKCSTIMEYTDEEITYRIVDSYCALPNDQRQGYSEITKQLLDGEQVSTNILRLRGYYFNDMRVGKWDLFGADGGFIGNCFYVNGKLKAKLSCEVCDEFEFE